MFDPQIFMFAKIVDQKLFDNNMFDKNIFDKQILYYTKNCSTKICLTKIDKNIFDKTKFVKKIIYQKLFDKNILTKISGISIIDQHKAKNKSFSSIAQKVLVLLLYIFWHDLFLLHFNESLQWMHVSLDSKIFTF